MQTNVVRSLTVRGQSQGLDQVKSDLDAVSAAQVKVGETADGMAKTTETSARRQLSAANNYNRLMEKHDRLIYLQRQMEREQQVVNRAFESGHISVDRHAQSLASVTTRFERMISAEQAARQQTTATTAAIDQQATALTRLAAANDNVAAANDNVRGSTANVAAQFQDIGVTAAMGMNPIMIALQQGTQLSSVLSTMQNPIKGLAMAFMSMVNPVSLLTIGFVALAAAAIQFFTSSKDEATKSADALETHHEWLDKLLEGYDGAAAAADRYREAAEKLPEGTVASDLGSAQEKWMTTFTTRLEALRQAQASFQADIEMMTQAGGDPAIIGQLQAVVDAVTDAGLTAESSADQFSALDTALAIIKNSKADDNARYIAEALLELLRSASAARLEVESLGGALQALPSNIVTTISINMEQFGEAQADLAGMMPDFRDRFTRMRDEAQAAFEKMRANATDGILRLQAESDLDRVLGGIDRLEAEDKARQAARGGGAGGGRATELEKMAGNYADLTQKAHEFIAQQELTASTLGMTAEAAARLRYEQDMLNQAANDNIALSPAQRAEIAALAGQMAAAEERARSLSESFNFGRDVFKGFFSDLRQNVEEGQSVWEAFYNAGKNAIDKLLDRAMDAALDQVWNNLWGSIMGMMGGGFSSSITGSAGGYFPGINGPSLNANGNVYSSPSLSAYSSQIVERPTMFAFERGAGIMGEAGPEAIMPLGRDGNGRLGVRVANGNAPATESAGVRVEIHNYSGQPVQQETSKGADGVDVTRIIIGTVNTAIAEGRLDGTMAATYGLKRRAA